MQYCIFRVLRVAPMFMNKQSLVFLFVFKNRWKGFLNNFSGGPKLIVAGSSFFYSGCRADLSFRCFWQACSTSC